MSDGIDKPAKNKSNGEESPPDRLRVLLAEDDTEMRNLLARSLTQEGYVVDECVDGTHLVARLVSADPEYFSVIISDVRMAGLSGLDFLEHLRWCNVGPPTILITAFGDPQAHTRARKLGAAAMLDKPFEMEELLAVVRRVVGETRARFPPAAG